MKTILWDNDGVLVDTEGLYFRACREILKRYDVELTLEQFQDVSLRQGESTFQLAIDKGTSEDEYPRFRQERDAAYTQLILEGSPINDGVSEVLESLHGRVTMGVVTSSLRSHFEAIHSHDSLLDLMDFVLTREDYVESKPDPEPYLTALSRHSLRKEECVVVEDSERGLASATAAGLRCVVVQSDWTKDGDFSAAEAVLSDFRTVGQWLNTEFLV